MAVKERENPEFHRTTQEVFVELTKTNYHVAFCTSPVGDTLRLRCRKFPSLINNCTLDWFHSWPKEALVSCCTSRLKDLKLSFNEELVRQRKKLLQA